MRIRRRRSPAWVAPGASSTRGVPARRQVARLEVRRGQRRAFVETLEFVAAELAQRIQLRRGFHALGDDRELQRMRHGEDRLDDRLVVRVRLHVAYERAVDLD